MPRSNSQTSPRRGSIRFLVQEREKGPASLADLLVRYRAGIKGQITRTAQYFNRKGLPIARRQCLKSAKGTLRAASMEGTRGCIRARAGSVLRVFLRRREQFDSVFAHGSRLPFPLIGGNVGIVVPVPSIKSLAASAKLSIRPFDAGDWIDVDPRLREREQYLRHPGFEVTPEGLGGVRNLLQSFVTYDGIVVNCGGVRRTPESGWWPLVESLVEPPGDRFAHINEQVALTRRTPTFFQREPVYVAQPVRPTYSHQQLRTHNGTYHHTRLSERNLKPVSSNSLQSRPPCAGDDHYRLWPMIAPVIWRSSTRVAAVLEKETLCRFARVICSFHVKLWI